jgi:hypothetical protein
VGEGRASLLGATADQGAAGPFSSVKQGTKAFRAVDDLVPINGYSIVPLILVKDDY